MSRTEVVGADLDGDGIFDDPVVIVVDDPTPPSPPAISSPTPASSSTSSSTTGGSFHLPSWKGMKAILIAMGCFFLLPTVVGIFLFFYCLIAGGI